MTFEIPWDEEPGFRTELLRYLLPQLPVAEVNGFAQDRGDMEMPATRLISVLGTASNLGIRIPAAWKDQVRRAGSLHRLLGRRLPRRHRRWGQAALTR